MAIIVGLGTVVQIDIADVFTAVPQITEANAPGAAPETFDAGTLDAGVGIPMKPTGRAAGKPASFSFFWDPVHVVHQAITDLCTTPALENWKFIFADAATTELPFSGTITDFDGPKVTANDGLKASVEITPDGIPTFAT
jgi:hypothetical protein